MSRLQEKVDALVARAATAEPTEEARTSAWIAIKKMREGGGRIVMGAAAQPQRAPFSWSRSNAEDIFRDAVNERVRREQQKARPPRRPAPKAPTTEAQARAGGYSFLWRDMPSVCRACRNKVAPYTRFALHQTDGVRCMACVSKGAL